MYSAEVLLLALQVSLAVCRPSRTEAAGLAAGQMEFCAACAVAGTFSTVLQASGGGAAWCSLPSAHPASLQATFSLLSSALQCSSMRAVQAADGQEALRAMEDRLSLAQVRALRAGVLSRLQVQKQVSRSPAQAETPKSQMACAGVLPGSEQLSGQASPAAEPVARSVANSIALAQLLEVVLSGSCAGRLRQLMHMPDAEVRPACILTEGVPCRDCLACLFCSAAIGCCQWPDVPDILHLGTPAKVPCSDLIVCCWLQ